MILGGDVLSMLIPTGGWVITGNDYEGIVFHDSEPITKGQFEQGLKDYPKWKLAQDKVAADKKATLLEKLGITQDEANLLLS